MGQYWWDVATCISHLGITLVTIGNVVLGLHQLFSLLDHLSSKTCDTLNEKKKKDLNKFFTTLSVLLECTFIVQEAKTSSDTLQTMIFNVWGKYLSLTKAFYPKMAHVEGSSNLLSSLRGCN